MARGRKPKPTHLKIVEGTTRADRSNPAEPKLPPGRPLRPIGMSDEANRVWPQIIDILDDMGVLTKADGMAVELLCEARADWVRAREQIEADGGETYETATGLIRAHPAVVIRNDAARRLQSLLAEFGMSPATRSRVNAKNDQEKDDPAAKFFG